MLLATPIEAIPATSPVTIKHLKSLGVNTFYDLLGYFPFRYEDYSVISPIARIQAGETVTVKGLITAAKNVYTRRGFKLQTVTLRDATGECNITWYNQPYLMHVFREGVPLSVAGQVSSYAGKVTLTPLEWEILKSDHIHTGRIVPVYSEVRGLSTRTIREKMFHAVSHLRETMEPPESIPPEVVQFNGLMGLHEAYLQIHFPADRARLAEARKRLGFDELLALQLSSLLTRMEWDKKSVSHRMDLPPSKEKKLQSFIKGLPFELTGDQEKAVADITGDMVKESPMNRFLQGDVGSGKTVVAAVAAYLSYLNGCSALVMAPTEILAQQHFKTMSALFKDTPVRVAIQTGSKKTALKEGEYDIIVGTQALLSRSVSFKKVGLVVIDEQHRFGVAQRALLKEKGGEPHLLTMTATPIPRTLALTLYGELDISVIAQMPKGRVPVRSYLVPPEKRQAAYEWIRKKVKEEKTQVFIICPLIEESEEETMQTMKAAKKEYEHLRTGIFPDLKVALLHGRLKPKEKEAVMQEFAQGESDVLVSTSVVEVGIDIPNASVMIIEGAQKFGMAQLHQLRGRVGRGSAQSHCLLFADNPDEGASARLAFFARHGNGAELAEYDLHHRGPGNIFGTSQHGYMKLRIAKLSDIGLIKQARDAAAYLAGKSPDLQAYPALKSQVASILAPQVARD